MLSEGALFRDIGLKRNSHGVEVHRVQWNLLMREILDNPEMAKQLKVLNKGKDNKAYDLKSFYVGLGKQNIKGNQVWGAIFGTFDENPTHPEWFWPSFKEQFNLKHWD